ncbi:MAG: beta-glucosidase [Chloroflexi bacterium]|nr:MAG: beta-glucosidase [Chloroflexota bacterium]
MQPIHTIDQTIEARIDDLLQQMTLAEKIGQMTQPEKNSVTPQAVTEYALGSVLSGGGGNPDPNTPANWAAMVREYAEAALKTRLRIPLIYGVDAVHGHNNVKGAVIYPHNIGLGATRDADLVQRIGYATAREVLATGVHWDFAPAVSVPQDIRWGRTKEGYSEDTALVTELAIAYIHGLQTPDEHGYWVLPSVKHFVGDGGTTWGTTVQPSWIANNWQLPVGKIDQGDTRLDEETLRVVHLAPYVEAIKAGALNIMVSFSSWNGLKMHAHEYLLTTVLKGELGFKGFLVSDWMAIDQLDADYYTCVVKSINAGLDMIMVPYDYKRFIETLTRAVENGDVAISRIDDAVRRILRAKFALGLFEQPLVDNISPDIVGAEAHRELAREAVRKSLVLLKNEGGALPLDKDASQIFLAGDAAADIGLACGGWTINWQGGRGAITDGRTLLEGLQAQAGGDVVYSPNAHFEGRAPLGVVVIAEEPYAEGMGDKADLSLSWEEISLIKKIREHCDKLVLVIYSGRPRILGDIVELCDAIVAAWLPGSEANAIADVLFGDVPFTGKLSFSWPRSMEQVPLSALKAHPEGPQWPFGHGLTT